MKQPVRRIERWVARGRENRFANKYEGKNVTDLKPRKRVTKYTTEVVDAIRTFWRSHESVKHSPNMNETLLVLDDDGKTQVRKPKLVYLGAVREMHNDLCKEVENAGLRRVADGGLE